MAVKTRHWHPLSRNTPPDEGRLGGKGANLVRLVRGGFPVPPGFVLATALFDAGRGPAGDRAVRDAVERGLALLPDGAEVAVRSSAVGEDGAGASFAGQHETLLGVRGVRGVCNAVNTCVASLDGGRAGAYRERHGAGPAKMAVVVQAMVRARAAGVLFTRHPVRRDLDRIVVEAVPGLGEALVSGHADPDRVELDRLGNRVSCEVAGERTECCLDMIGDSEFADLARRLEREFGGPQDAEWAWDGECLWVLQTRPITATPVPREAWSRTWGDEFWAESTTELQFTFLGRWIRDQYLGEVARICGWGFLLDVEPFARVHSRVYFNSEYLWRLAWMVPPPLRFERYFSWMPPAWRAALPGAPFRPGVAVRGLVRSRLADSRAGILRHHRMLAGYVKDVAERIRPRLGDDPASLSDEVLWNRLLELDRMGKEHFRQIRWGLGSYMLPLSLVCAWIGDRWGDDPDGLVADRLVSAATESTLTMEVNREIGRLGAMAARIPGALEILSGTGDDAGEMLRKLPGGDELAGGLERFLSLHGHRGASRELDQPRWHERPDMVYGMVAACAPENIPKVPAPEGGMEDVERRWLGSIRDKPLGAARVAVAKKVLALARAYARYRENQRYGLDFILADMRRVVRETARRLARQGLLDDPGHVFHLTREEYFAMWLHGAPAPPDLEDRAVQHDRDLRGPAPEWILDGEDCHGENAPDAGGLYGTGASPGVAEGPARIVNGHEDLSRVRPGEVLVAANTDPGWTPVFSIASAVVVECGGILSHAAIVAREYGIPAVTGVSGARNRIRAGEVIRVDGGAGRVVKVDEEG